MRTGEQAMIFLAIDFGTSAVKMSLIDENLQVKSVSSDKYNYVTFPGEKNELRQEDLFNAFYGAAKGLDEELLKKTEMIVFDTFSPSPVFLDKEGALVYPNVITHMDRRSRAQTQYISDTFGNDRYRNISGIYPFPGGCSAMTFLWFKQNMPEVLEKTHIVGHFPTFIYHWLTGEFMVDFVNASMMGMYETTTQGTWSKELIKEFGFDPAIFGPIYNPGEVHGYLVKEVADKLGIKAGIPVAVGTNDVATAQMGAGNDKAGGIMNTTGSSEMVSILVDKALIDPDNYHYYLRNAALPGLWQIYVTTCGGFGIDWFRKEFCKEMSEEEFFAYEADEISKYIAAGNNNGITFDPYLTGDRQDLPKKTAGWHGIDLNAGPTRGQMLVALLASIQDVMIGAMSKAQEICTLDPVVKLAGGMSKSEPYRRMKLNAYQALGVEGLQLQYVENCETLGCVQLAKHYMK